MKHTKPSKSILTTAVAAFAAAAALNATDMQAKDTTYAYPRGPQDPTVVDNYFDLKVPDLYRPLENDTAAETLEWVRLQNELTDSYLAKIPYRDQLRKRLTALIDYPKVGLKSHGRDGRWYFYRNDGLQNQYVLCRKPTLDTPDEEAEVFLDPNTLSDDGTVALTGVHRSPDGKYTAYTISRSGSDWTEIFVMDTDTKELLNDHIEWAKFTTAAWHGDGFFYSAYDRPVVGKEFSNSNENHRIYYHKIGTPQSEDVLVFTDPEHPLHFHSADVPDDSDYLVVYASGEGVGECVQIKDLLDPAAPWIVVEPTQDYSTGILDIDRKTGQMLIMTNYGAPRNRVVTASIDAPTRDNWQDFIPEGEGVLTKIQPSGNDYLLALYEQDAVSRLYVHDRKSGKRLHEVALPGPGSVACTADKKRPEVFYSFTSFTTPADIYSYDIATNTSKLIDSTKLNGFNPDDYITEQVFYPSADGTRIPMCITYKKGMKRDGNNPVFLYGYGGFNISLTPSFSAFRLLWLENGGIYAQANLRGGSEYGEEWHQAGTKLNKLNVFNDFIAAAEYLIDNKWSSPELMTAHGGSNGGLLVGAVTNMRPDLFKVAVPRVGVMDMMRYHLFTIGWNWASDYGTSADSPEMAAYLLGYSPLHNIKDGAKYPAVLVTTADHDDRVVPAHSFKYAATLQAAETGSAPKLIRIESKAGHGAGKPLSKQVDEQADIYAFLFENLGITPVTE